MLDPSRRFREEFIIGVHEFFSTAMNQACYTLDGGIKCPCVRCICEKTLKPSHVRAHLLQYGFKPNYKVWTDHGKERQNEDNFGYASTNHGNMNVVDM